MAFRINPYRQSVTPYRRPLVPPVVDPDFNPVNVPVSCAWLSYIIGALSILTEQATWDTEDPDEMLTAIERATNLIAIFTAAAQTTGCVPFPVAIACDDDFTAAQGAWTLVPGNNQGSYAAGVGWQSQHFDANNQQAAYIERVFSPAVTITHLEATYDASGAGSGASNNTVLWIDQGSGPQIVFLGTVQSGVNTFSIDQYFDNVIAVQVSMNTGTAASPFVITDAHIDGYAPSAFTC